MRAGKLSCKAKTGFLFLLGFCERTICKAPCLPLSRNGTAPNNSHYSFGQVFDERLFCASAVYVQPLGIRGCDDNLVVRGHKWGGSLSL